MESQFFALNAVSLKGVATCLPSRKVENDFFKEVFSETEIAEVTKISGVRSRRWADEKTTASDLCLKAAFSLLRDLKWEKNSVDAIVYVTQTPDYRIPSTAIILQNQLGLRTSIPAFDINLGCSGYVYGLWVLSQLMQMGTIKRALLLAGDTVSKFVNPKDRSTALLFGDGGSASALEYDQNAEKSYFLIGSDGSGAKNLYIPCGGFRKTEKEEVSALSLGKPESFQRTGDELYMNGSEIFNFTIKTVPSLVQNLLQQSNVNQDEISKFLFHQANEFILNYLIKKAKLPLDKAPINISKFGNTSVCSIPLLITSELETDYTLVDKKICLAGFGVGYSWAGAILSLKNLAVIHQEDYK